MAASARKRPLRPIAVVLLLCASGVLSGWVDPDTPEHATRTTSYADGTELELVMSDEFEDEGRTFHDGEDPRWTALEKDDYTNAALHYYKADLARVKDGRLEVNTILKESTFRALDIKTKKYTTKKKYYQSAMVQGWNKFCFKGGAVEMRAQLPGSAYVSGLWPALWMLGNLARATYVGSSDYMWPWSYDKCKGRSPLTVQQELNACQAAPHYGLHARQGRGAPEIDILEAMPGMEKLQRTKVNKPYLSSSLQVSPGVEEQRPMLGFPPKNGTWYEGMHFAKNTSLNIFFYGVKLEHKPKEYSYQSDAISANTNLDASHFDSMHTYRVEWEPDEYIRWYIDGELLFAVDSSNLQITGASIPSEPMYLLINTAVSETWGFPRPLPPDCDACYDPCDLKCACAVPMGLCQNLPATFAVDWVRVFQNANSSSHSVGCSPPSHPSRRFIQAHESRYKMPEDDKPLKAVARGGGACEVDAQCRHGSCERDRQGLSKCVCDAAHSGPYCMSPIGFDDDYTPDDALHLHPSVPFMPTLLAAFAAALCGTFVATLLARVKWRRETAQRNAYVPLSS